MTAIIFFSLLVLITTAYAGKGNGDLRLGYTFIDEEGNQSVNQSTFNHYPGLGLSLEKFRYNFDNGVRFGANLKNITLNNRNLSVNMSKPGLLGAEFTNNQYRRIYDFEGTSFTRRHQTGGSLWFYPQRYLKIFGGASLVGLSGSTTDLFSSDGPEAVTQMDYDRNCYNAGLRFNYKGRMFQAEYRSADYDDRKDSSRDQRRYHIRLDGLMPLPEYEKLILSGGFRHFETKYKKTDFKISANTVWGGATIDLTKSLAINYNFAFDRTSSDSDLVATDNISHTGYITYKWNDQIGITGGYQYDIRDDYANSITGNSYYLSEWFRPSTQLEFRGEFGNRSEKVDDGARLVGDEDRNRFKLTARYTNPSYGSLAVRVENKKRDNDQIGSKIDFQRQAADGTLKLTDIADLSAGYSLSRGDYENREQKFKFTDHQLYADINSREYHNLTAGFGILYYRSKRDLDIECFTLHFTGSFRFMKNNRIEVDYNVHNFDDFLVSDRYYTANIVEINLIKELSI